MYEHIMRQDVAWAGNYSVMLYYYIKEIIINYVTCI